MTSCSGDGFYLCSFSGSDDGVSVQQMNCQHPGQNPTCQPSQQRALVQVPAPLLGKREDAPQPPRHAAVPADERLPAAAP
jgi:hypothetical protein